VLEGMLRKVKLGRVVSWRMVKRKERWKIKGILEGNLLREIGNLGELRDQLINIAKNKVGSVDRGSICGWWADRKGESGYS